GDNKAVEAAMTQPKLEESICLGSVVNSPAPFSTSSPPARIPLLSRRAACAAALLLLLGGGAVLISQTGWQLPTNDREQAAKPRFYPAVLLPFKELGPEVKDYGANVGGLLFARLAENPDVYLVDREDLKHALAEQELSLSGLVDAAKAARI